MKKLLIVVALALVLLCLPTAATADEAYDILSHDVHITVSENNVIDVVERMVYDFTQERHGIYYNLQYKGIASRYIDDQWVDTKYDLRVFDFNVIGNNFTTSKEDGFLIAKIGDADKYVFGEQEYIITYKVDMGDNGYDEFDEFYRNIINCAYGDTIDSASFIIEFPKSFDEKLVGVSMGQYGSAGTNDVSWEVDGNTLKGHTLRTMVGGESLTVRIEFPDDYFVGESNGQQTWDYVVYGVAGLSVLLALILWLIFGRDSVIYPTVEFYAPDGMTSAEAGYIIDGCVDDKDVLSLLMYWADKGYMKITEVDKKEFEFTKLKELPSDAKTFEKTMFTKLFANGDVVLVSSLTQTFYTTMESTKTGVKNYFEGAKKRNVFTTSSKRARGFMNLLTMLPIAFALFRFIYNSSDSLLMSAAIAVFAAWVIGVPVFILVRQLEKWRSAQPAKRITKLVFTLVFLVIVLAIYIFVVPLMLDITDDFAAVPIMMITSLATIILTVLTAIMRKRTEQGDEWMGKLLGFKHFIETAEKDRIQLLVEENPSYFFNVLPYAYVLGVTNKWAKNFEGIGMQQPSWYDGGYRMNTFNTILFTSMMTNNMTSFRSTMTSRPPSSSGGGFSGGGGGFSGGGFSGGGFGGGGGGGSW